MDMKYAQNILILLIFGFAVNASDAQDGSRILVTNIFLISGKVFTLY